jgi:hypothetical protein
MWSWSTFAHREGTGEALLSALRRQGFAIQRHAGLFHRATLIKVKANAVFQCRSRQCGQAKGLEFDRCQLGVGRWRQRHRDVGELRTTDHQRTQFHWARIAGFRSQDVFTRWQIERL